MSEPPLIDIRPDHWEIVRAILKKHVPDREVWAFGSRAKWTAKQYSDLDLAVLGDESLDLDVQAGLEEDFSESDLPFKVDVVDWATTAETFRGIIGKDKVVVHQVEVVSSEWGVQSIESCMEAIIDYRGKTPRKTLYGIPLITAKIVKGGRIETPNEFIAVDDYERWMTRGIPKAGDIVVTTEAPLGEIAQLGNERVALAQRLIALRGKSGVLDNGFLKFLMQSENVQDQLRARASGTTVLGIKQSELRNILLTLPPLSEQRAIAQVLGGLDDKIELNRRMNADLEAMAQALFKDWFVDFGPVRAKVEGRQAYLAWDIWELFPGALDDEDKPLGWQFGVLHEVADSPRRGVNPAEVSEDTPYIGLEHMPRRSIALADWAHAGKVTSNKSVFKKGEFLFGKLRPYFHKVGIAAINGICSTDIVVVCPKGKEWSAYILACISSDPFVNYTDKLSNGAKMPRTSWDDMGAYEVCLPGKSVAQAFENTVAPTLEQVIVNIHESQTLSYLRDLLLPKLITGEIRVRDAEKAMEAAL
ncbi:MAG: restriction endonuclease subunit S [Magnetococcales bacterium]|nr:restriction endonuclease subunit S [Magnetococcales bacterium]